MDTLQIQSPLLQSPIGKLRSVALQRVLSPQLSEPTGKLYTCLASWFGPYEERVLFPGACRSKTAYHAGVIVDIQCHIVVIAGYGLWPRC